jgi:drug/metabolite transporter (DMT)-like permease
MQFYNSEYLGPLSAFSASIIWAIASTQYAQLTQKHTPFSINFTRALIGLPLFVVATCIVSGGLIEGYSAYKYVTLTQIQWAFISMISSYGFGDILFLWGAGMIGLPAALAIASCAPIWSIIGEIVFLNKPIIQHQIIGIIVTVVGIIMVVLSNKHTKIHSNQGTKTLGVILAGATSVFWALNGFAIAKLASHTTVTIANTLRMLAALVITLGLGRVLQPHSRVMLPLKTLKQYTPLILLDVFLGSFIVVYALSHTRLSLGITLTSLAPVLSVPIAVFLKLETFSWKKTLGIIIVVLGVSYLLGVFTNH